jgi:hypothetical protein
LPFLSTMSIIVNTFTMSAASIERFISIVNPFLCKLKKNQCILIIFVIWMLAVVASVPWFFLLEIRNVPQKTLTIQHIQTFSDILASNFGDDFNFTADLSEDQDDEYAAFGSAATANDTAVEDELPLMLDTGDMMNTIEKMVTSYKKMCPSKNENLTRSYFLFLCIVEYVIPLMVLSLTYAIIGYYLYVSNNNGQDNNHNNNNKILSRENGGGATSNKSSNSLRNRKMLSQNKKRVFLGQIFIFFVIDSIVRLNSLKGFLCCFLQKGDQNAYFNCYML